MKFTLSILLFLSLGLLESRSAGTNRFTAKIISKSVPSTGLSRVVWHPSSAFISYLRPVGPGEKTTNVLFTYNPETRSERKFLAAPVIASDSGSRTNEIRLSLSEYQWSPTGDALLLTGDGDLWRIAVEPLSGRTEAPRRVTHDRQSEELVSFSPDGTRIAFVKTNNLFAVEIASGRVTQLTEDGGELILNGKLDWVYGEEFSHVPKTGALMNGRRTAVGSRCSASMMGRCRNIR